VSTLNGYAKACALAALWTTSAVAQPAHFTSMNSFANTNGAYPWSTLIQGTDGNFYGTTQNGGKYTHCVSGMGCGTVFKMTPRGKLSTVVNFNGTNGSQPFAALVQGPDGTLYGTTLSGGGKNKYFPNGAGTVFAIPPGGKLTTLYHFSGLNDGASPGGALIFGADGNLYGTTGEGGDNAGTIFKLTPAGVLTTLFDFDYYAYGIFPEGALVQTKNGDLYGVTLSGGSGANGSGTIYRLDPRGHYTVMHSFNLTDGGSPYAGLLIGADGNFYGSTENGGEYVGYGTIFKMTPDGHLTTLHSFDVTDGDVPVGTLIQGTNGKFYGTTAYGGTDNAGTVFEMTAGGKLTTLHSFDGTDGASVYDGLLLAKNGKLYGDTFGGGTSTNCGGYGCGALFSLSAPR
jgi:uncharacterized repeat protein (TIGR03803 family)